MSVSVSTVRDISLDQAIADVLLTHARAAGAEHAEVMLSASEDSMADVRLGKVEQVESSRAYYLGMRAWVGGSAASVTSSSLPASLARLDEYTTGFAELAERVVAMAKVAPPDACARLATASEYMPSAQQVARVESIDAFDEAGLHQLQTPGALQELALLAEDAARADARITNSDGAAASSGWGRSYLATSQGFTGGHCSTRHSVSACVLAGKQGEAMERDYAYSMARHAEDLISAEALGVLARERTLARMGSRRVKGGHFPVLFDPRAGRGVLANIISAVSGAAIARGTSFLKDAMHTQIFHPSVCISDDPLRPRGLASRPWDAEGLAPGRLELVQQGELKHWLLDIYSANKLHMQSNARAKRSAGSPSTPGATNLTMHAGALSRDALIRETGTGLLVTEMQGMGINLVTGDFSQGASGFWIENGEITHAVSEVTIAGTLQEMMQHITLADDLHYEQAVNCPTFRVESMVIGGE